MTQQSKEGSLVTRSKCKVIMLWLVSRGAGVLAGGPFEVVTASTQEQISVPSTELSLHSVASSQIFAWQTTSSCHKVLRFVSIAQKTSDHTSHQCCMITSLYVRTWERNQCTDEKEREEKGNACEPDTAFKDVSLKIWTVPYLLAW